MHLATRPTKRWLRRLAAGALRAGSILSASLLSANVALAHPDPSVNGGPQPPMPIPAAATPEEQQNRRRQVVVLLRDLQGKQLGSGVLVANANGGDWVLTNRHVVQSAAQVCVITADGRPQTGGVEPQPGPWQDLDLALVWLPRPQLQPARPVATTIDPALAVGELAVVVAAGHPAQSDHGTSAGAYREERGLLLPLLQGPLREGFDLTYTAAVQKGMSGGGLFLGDRLIGVNGAHAHPLWPGSWQRADGSPVSEPLDSQLELVAIGLSSRHLQSLHLQDRAPGRPPNGAEATTACAAGASPASLTPTF